VDFKGKAKAGAAEAVPAQAVSAHDGE
jgi:hypothetical protein